MVMQFWKVTYKRSEYCIFYSLRKNSLREMDTSNGRQDYHWKKKTHAVKALRITKSYSVSVPQKVLQKTQTG